VPACGIAVKIHSRVGLQKAISATFAARSADVPIDPKRTGHDATGRGGMKAIGAQNRHLGVRKEIPPSGHGWQNA
jgi:hypothetical protein